MAGVGDLNGDGRADVAVSRAVQCCPILHPSSSFVQVFFGSGSFPRKVDFDTLDPTLGVTLDPVEENTLFGRYISTAGDFDGDGRPDLLIGAPNAYPESRTVAGEAYVLLSRAGFAAPGALHGDFPGARFMGQGPSEHLGGPVAPAGDFDGDGFDDVLAISRKYVGARGREAFPGFCRAYLLYGGPADTVPLALFDVEPPFGPRSGGTTVVVKGSGFAAGARVTFGAVDAPSVDVRSSTVLEAVVPPGPRALVDVSVSLAGETRTLAETFYYSSILPVDLDSLGPRGFTIHGVEDMKLGETMAAGDFDGDGIDDLVLSACRATWMAEGDYDCFAVLVRGRQDPLDLRPLEAPESVTTFHLADPPAVLVAGAPGDVDGDGIEDFVLTFDTGTTFATGSGVLILGRREWPESVDIADLFVQGGVTEFVFPLPDQPPPVASLGDMDGDGIDDFVLGIQADPRGGPGGELVFLAGRPSWDALLDLPLSASGRVRAGSETGHLGWQLAAVGDVNGDVSNEFVVRDDRFRW